MTDSDFSPADAEANAAGLRQRLDDMEGWWRDRAPEPVRKAGSRAWSAGYELGRPPPLPAAGKAAVRAGNRHCERRR